MSITILDTENFIEFAKKLGANNIKEEDEAIAFCLNQTEEDVWAPAFARLQEKYKDIVRSYVEHRHPEMSAIGKDMTFDMTFDRIRNYRASATIETKNGGLGGFVCLICEWEVQRVSRKENRRHDLLVGNFQDLWCIQRDQADAFRGDAISEKDVWELLNAIQISLNPMMYPATARVMNAISANYLNTNGHQIEKLSPNPSLTGIKNYLDQHGSPMSEDEIRHCLKILRARAKTVLEENGWELNLASKYVQ